MERWVDALTIGEGVKKTFLHRPREAGTSWRVSCEESTGNSASSVVMSS